MKIPKLGDTGENVEILQEALNKRGASLVVDGEFGPATHKAVSLFQLDKGMLGSGIIGPKTMAALELEITDESSLTISTGRDADEGTRTWYRRMYFLCKLDPGLEVNVKADSKRVLKVRARYQAVADKLEIPWWIIALIHMKEASLNFHGVLHNGEKIVGTNKKTKLVPAGKGPFATWEDSAVDALQSFVKRLKGDFEIGNVLYYVERYNGTGHITGAGKNETSPYLWGRTNVNDDYGRYTYDGKFDPNASNQRSSGFCAVLKVLEEQGIYKPVYGEFDRTDALDKADENAVFNKIIELNPGINPKMVSAALPWADKASNKKVITMVDFTMKSSEDRLYQIDMVTLKARRELVAHGKFSDEDNDGFVDSVGNVSGSNKSSKGAALTHKTYHSSKFGYALRLDGLEEGINDNILKRAMVVHKGSYVSDLFVSKYGRVGRTLGCWGLDPKVYKAIIDKAGIGSLWYSFYE